MKPTKDICKDYVRKWLNKCCVINMVRKEVMKLADRSIKENRELLFRLAKK